MKSFITGRKVGSFFVPTVKSNGPSAMLVSAILATGLSGCFNGDGHDVIDSPGVTTNSMSAETHVSYTGSQVVTVEVMLRDGPITANNDINLIAGDSLKASTVGDPSNLNFGDDLFDNLIDITNQVKTLRRGTRRIYDHTISGIWYYATIEAKYRDKEFTVSLLRDSHNDAPNSVVSLPPDFSISIDELAGGGIVSRSGPITVNWTPANAGYFQEISAFINCADGASGEWSVEVANNDPGNPINRYEIPADTFQYTGSCNITLGMEHSALGSADPALHLSSIIRAHQYRTIAISTVE